MAGDEQQGLLAAHAAAERVDALRSMRSHGRARSRSPASGRGRRSGRGSRTRGSRLRPMPSGLTTAKRPIAGRLPQYLALRAVAAAAVRRDDERQRRVLSGRTRPGGARGLADDAVVGGVVDLPDWNVSGALAPGGEAWKPNGGAGRP